MLRSSVSLLLLYEKVSLSLAWIIHQYHTTAYSLGGFQNIKNFILFNPDHYKIVVYHLYYKCRLFLQIHFPSKEQSCFVDSLTNIIQYQLPQKVSTHSIWFHDMVTQFKYRMTTKSWCQQCKTCKYPRKDFWRGRFNTFAFIASSDIVQLIWKYFFNHSKSLET